MARSRGRFFRSNRAGGKDRDARVISQAPSRASSRRRRNRSLFPWARERARRRRRALRSAHGPIVIPRADIAGHAHGSPLGAVSSLLLLLPPRRQNHARARACSHCKAHRRRQRLRLSRLEGPRRHCSDKGCRRGSSGAAERIALEFARKGCMVSILGPS